MGSTGFARLERSGIGYLSNIDNRIIGSGVISVPLLNFGTLTPLRA